MNAPFQNILIISYQENHVWNFFQQSCELICRHLGCPFGLTLENTALVVDTNGIYVYSMQTSRPLRLIVFIPIVSLSSKKVSEKYRRDLEELELLKCV